MVNFFFFLLKFFFSEVIENQEEEKKNNNNNSLSDSYDSLNLEYSIIYHYKIYYFLLETPIIQLLRPNHAKIADPPRNHYSI